MIVEELYDALIEAGATEEKARAASRAIADMEGHFANIERGISRLDQKIELGISKLDQKLELDISKLDQKIEGDISKLDQKIEKEISRLDQRIERETSRLDQRISEFRSYVDQRFTKVDGILQLHKWMLGTILAFIVAVFFKVFSR